MGLANWWYVLQTTRLSKPAKDRALFQATRNQKILSVLETGIGDGSRCSRLIQWLRHHQSVPARYAAIDMFEASGSIPLKQFHSQLSAAGIKPLPVPGTLASGLPRVAHTIGAVDLLILNQDTADLSDLSVQGFLPRVVHPRTIVLATDAATGYLYALNSSALLEAGSGQHRAAA